jgi:hypothetical protein
MIDQTPQTQQRSPDTSPGYRTATLTMPAGRRRKRAAEPAPADHLTFLDDVNQLATAQGDRVWLYRTEDMTGSDDAVRPIAEVRTPARVVHLQALIRGGSPEIVVALDDNSLWAIVFPNATSPESRSEKPRSRVLVEDLGGRVRHLLVTRRNLLLVVENRERAGTELVEVDPARAAETRRAPLPLGRLTSIHPLDPARNELLVAVDARHGAHLVGFPTDQDGTTVRLMGFDPSARVTAAAAVDDQWMVLARKGGEIIQARYTSAVGGRGDSAVETCRRLRAILRECGCECLERQPETPCGDDDGPGRPDDHGHGRPDDGTTGPRPGLTDDEPCEERRRAHLGWTVAALHKAGHFLTAMSERGDRMAVLDRKLDVVYERYLGPRGAMLAPGDATTDRILTLPRGTSRIEAWSLDDYARAARGLPVTPPARPYPVNRAHARTVTFRGRRSPRSTPNPHLNVAVFTVTEPGQAFGDPDQARMQALLGPNVYDIVADYYRENSFDTFNTQFSVFGVHLGTPRRPLVLPRSIASYFYDEFTPGGIEAVMPGDWADPLALDGTESMTLRSDPAVGTGKDYPVEFAALWTSRGHDTYPVVINLAGTETLQVDVIDQAGTLHALTLDFGPLALNHAQGDNEAAFLAALGQHVTNAIRAAEAAVGVPQVLQDVVFRRIRSNDDDMEFGRLQCQFRVTAAPGSSQKGRVSITLPAVPAAGLVALGLTDPNPRSGVLGSRLQIVNYLAECLHATRFDAGEGTGLNDPHLATAVLATEDAGAGVVRARIQLATEKGGAGAEITRVAASGLAASGWSTAIPVPGSESNSNNRNTMRYHQDLANDVFTAAMDHIRASGPWNAAAVRAQFDGFDAMMIGFVGACPTSVPIADRWNSVDAVDFGRLRMFVRYHQATDLNNPNPSEPPVTMGTDLLIGQRFNQFDPGVMSHEIGHGLGLPDLYAATGFRDDVAYVDRWCQMAGGNSRFNHFCAWSKWSVG